MLELKSAFLLRTSHFAPRTFVQPFFPTKPTGQGTGLGLSLSYGIIKAHGRELKVETGLREGTDFIIQLTGNKLQ